MKESIHVLSSMAARSRRIVLWLVLAAHVAFVAAVASCGVLTGVAAQPTRQNVDSGNSYHFFTKALHVDESGGVAVPSRFKWSVESCVAGYDLQGKPIPDSRVMLRLYDPDHNFTALTAQMDLETAQKLQRELADVIGKKRQNPDYQHRPQLYDPSLIPTGQVKGVDTNGQLIIELQSKTAK